MKRCLLFVILLNFGVYSYSQSESTAKSLSGRYQFYNDDSLFSITLIIKNDHSFIYDRATDLTEKSSEGSWTISHDTLVLNSYDQINKVRIDVKEKITTGRNIKFNDVKLSNGKIIPLVMLSINGDSTKLYDPIDTTYIFHLGDIKTLSLIVGRTRSEVYTVKNKRASQLDIILKMNQSPNDYVFMHNAKFVLAGSSILPTTENKIDSITVNMTKRVPILLVKIK